MSKVGEKVAYLKGLAEGLGVNDETEQGKLMLAMIDTLEALAKNSEETDERVGELSEYVEEIDSDVSDLEEALFSEEDDDDEEDEEDDEEDEDDDEDGEQRVGGAIVGLRRVVIREHDDARHGRHDAGGACGVRRQGCRVRREGEREVGFRG